MFFQLVFFPRTPRHYHQTQQPAHPARLHACCAPTSVLQDALAAAAEQDAAAAANARQRADQLLAEAEVAAAERMLEAAELEFNSAKRTQSILQQELGQVRARLCCDTYACVSFNNA